MKFGHIGYAAYAESTGGKTFDGRPMPTFTEIEERTPHVAKAWHDASIAVARAVTEQFAAPSYTKGATYPFGVALVALKSGRRVSRLGWNGKGMWLALTPGSVIPVELARAGAAEHAARQFGTGDRARGSSLTIAPHIDMRAADGTFAIGWHPSQADMLADDWAVLPD